MIKIKRLKNLKLFREKTLNKIALEINTLNGEIKKSSNLEEKLQQIKQNSKKNYVYKNSWNIKQKYDFERKIIEQISICNNRVHFLERELLRAKTKLGSIILQKNIIEKKIKASINQKLQEQEDKSTRDTPNFKKS